MSAVSIMDFQAWSRGTSPQRRRELFELYLRRHDRIDTWDLGPWSHADVRTGHPSRYQPIHRCTA